MRIGLGMAITQPNGASLDAAIRALFAANEQGAWFDPSDLSSMFQDSAGTTPVTAVGQPVGLRLDKRKGLVRGTEIPSNGAYPAGAAVNNGNGTFTIPDGSSVRFGFPQASLKNGAYYEISFEVVSLSGTVNSDLCDTGTCSFTSTGLKRYIASRATYDATYNFVDILPSGGGSAVVKVPTLRELPGNHASQPTAASRAILQQDSSGRYYLAYDGVDDFYVTPSIDFTGTDKMTVVAGVRKNSDANTAMLAELSATADATAGAFYFGAPVTATSSGYRAFQRGATNAAAPSAPIASYPAGVSHVVSSTMDLGAPSINIRVNGGTANTSVSATGGGNFTNAPIYIGRRGGTSFPFNGREYGIIIRGAASDASQLSGGEMFMNSKSGAY